MTFEAVSRLDEPAIRALLAGGDPVERIWAVWSLALKATRGHTDVAAHVAHEPNPGVRRTLAVVLAGHGHLELLVELASADPDPEVRASAMRLVVLQAAGGRIPWSLVTERHACDLAVVRAAILGQLPTGVPAEMVQLVLRGLDDDDRELRFTAFEALVRLRGTDAALLAVIHRWLERASDEDRAIALTRWALVEESASVIASVVESSRSVRQAVIRTLRLTGWSRIAPLVELDAELLMSCWWACQLDLAELPLTVLIEMVARSSQDPLLGELARRLETGVRVSEAQRRRLLEIADRCQRTIDEIRAETDLPDDEGVPNVESLEQVRDLARRS